MRKLRILQHPPQHLVQPPRKRPVVDLEPVIHPHRVPPLRLPRRRGQRQSPHEGEIRPAEGGREEVWDQEDLVRRGGVGLRVEGEVLLYGGPGGGFGCRGRLGCGLGFGLSLGLDFWFGHGCLGVNVVHESECR